MIRKSLSELNVSAEGLRCVSALRACGTVLRCACVCVCVPMRVWMLCARRDALCVIVLRVAAAPVCRVLPPRPFASLCVSPCPLLCTAAGARACAGWPAGAWSCRRLLPLRRPCPSPALRILPHSLLSLFPPLVSLTTRCGCTPAPRCTTCTDAALSPSLSLSRHILSPLPWPRS